VEIAYVFASIVLLVLLISWGKVQPFLAFLVASSVAAILLGLPLDKVPGVLEKGIGNILGGLLGIVCIVLLLAALMSLSHPSFLGPLTMVMTIPMTIGGFALGALAFGWTLNKRRLWYALTVAALFGSVSLFLKTDGVGEF